MKKIDMNNLLNQMIKVKMKFPDSVYENIKKNIKLRRIQKRRELVLTRVYFPIVKYALASIVMLAILFAWFYYSTVHVTVIRKKGDLNIAAAKNKWERYSENMKIKQGYYIQTGKNCELSLKFGKNLFLNMNGENIIKIEKMKKFLWNEEYKFHLYKGNQIYEILNNKIDFILSTDNAVIRPIGTKFSVVANNSETRIDVLEGKIAVKRAITNRSKINNLKYTDNGYQKLLESVLETEAIIKQDEMAYVDKSRNNRVNSLILNLLYRDETIDYDTLLDFEKYIKIRRIKQGKKEIQKRLVRRLAWERFISSAIK